MIIKINTQPKVSSSGYAKPILPLIRWGYKKRIYRAAYGKGVLDRLSAKLTERFGRGWLVETLIKTRGSVMSMPFRLRDRRNPLRSFPF